jgi:hypothetical protein
VPTIEPASVIWLVVVREMPKSVTLKRPSPSVESSASSTLCGLMSRWTIPRRCAKPRARRIWRVISIALPIGSGPSATICSLRLRPSRNSIAM